MKDADAIILHQEPLRARVLTYALAFAVVLLLVRAELVQVDEITRGDAKVIPARQLQVLQSLDGGIVSQILVKEGKLVSEGQVLLQVDSIRFESTVRENRSQYLSLLAKAARLRAIGENKPFVPPPEALTGDPQTVAEERRLYKTATSELQTQLTIARQQLAQRPQERNEASSRRRQAAQSYESRAREMAITRPLLASGAVSEVELLRLQRDVDRNKAEGDIATAQIARVQASIAESTRKVREVELTYRNTASKKYSETISRHDQPGDWHGGDLEPFDESMLKPTRIN